MNAFCRIFLSDIRLLIRQRAEWASLLLFIIIVLLLTPFALGPEPELLRKVAPGLIWIAVLLMTLLSFDHLFVQDARDGTLDEMLTSPHPLGLIVFSKLSAHTIILFMTLLGAIGPAIFLFDLKSTLVPVLLASFALGVPILIFFGGIAGAVTIALQRNAALLILLLVPFYIPVLIFAVSACDLAIQGQSATQPLLFLSAILALLLPTAPFIIAASLRHGQG